MTFAKIFWSGNSQAVRLPKEFRFSPETREVEVRREDDRVILAPVKTQEWPTSFWDAFGSVSEDFERPASHPQRRDSLDP